MTTIPLPTGQAMHWLGAITDIHDGDTATVDLDLHLYVNRRASTVGFHLYVEPDHRLHIHQALRLAGLNAIELDQPGGIEARDHLAALMPVGSQVTVTTWLDGTDKYGRILGLLAPVAPAAASFNQCMVDDGYAAPWDGRGPKPVPAWPLVVTNA